MTERLYCTVDTSRVGEEDQGKAEPGLIRVVIEKKMRTIDNYNNWRCVAVNRDSRNGCRIRVT
jgi:hypothetical protein